MKHSSRKILGIIVLFWTVSISLVFINKKILGNAAFKMGDISIFVAWFQCLTGVLILHTTNLCTKKVGTYWKFPSVHLDVLLSPEFLKLGLFCVFGLTLNNLMLKHISISFYQVARSSTLIFTVIMSTTILGKPIKIISVVCCGIVLCGFLLTIDQEDSAGTLSVWGIIYGIFASLFTALCGIYFKQVEKLANDDSLKITFYNNINCCLIFTPLVYSTGQLSYVMRSPLVTSFQFWLLLCVTGVLSLSIGWVSSMQIKYTSPTTHHVSNTAKTVFQTLLAVLVAGEQKSALWWLGNSLVVFGVFYYAIGHMNTSPKSKCLDKEYVISQQKN